jgi:hypothetical protein
MAHKRIERLVHANNSTKKRYTEKIKQELENGGGRRSMDF